jgi:1-acyl-sn-glycerol-3-phosphate acyltransferase
MILFRSFLFAIWFVMVTVVIFIGALPSLLLPRTVIVRISRLWSRATFFGLRVLAGIDCQVRGDVPAGPVLIASKHMSMWDTMGLYLLIWDPAVVLKRELLRIPFYGWYLRKAGIIPVDRSAHAAALRRMTKAAKDALRAGRPILIFPEGTRKAPGAPTDYKPGVAGLYSLLGAPCVPVALNSGLFWTGPLGLIKKPGRIVVEFLEPVPAGLKRDEFMQALEQRIETASAKLVAEGQAALRAGST